MKNKILNFIVLLASLISVSMVLAEQAEFHPNERRMTLYFCSKDLDMLGSSSIPSDKSVEGYPDNHYISVGDGDDEKHTFLRHCFILLGDEIIALNNGRKIVMRIINSAGYMVIRDNDQYGYVVGEPWLARKEERDKFTISCARIMQEGDVGNNKYVSGRAVVDVFDKLEAAMKHDAKSSPYNAWAHNCCSVAYNGILNSPFLKDAVKNINIRDYNLLGRGIEFEWTQDDAVALLLGSAHSTHSAAFELSKLIAQSSEKSLFIVANVVTPSTDEANDVVNTVIENSDSALEKTADTIPVPEARVDL
jgi:hypothetical protein